MKGAFAGPPTSLTVTGTVPGRRTTACFEGAGDEEAFAPPEGQRAERVVDVPGEHAEIDGRLLVDLLRVAIHGPVRPIVRALRFLEVR